MVPVSIFLASLIHHLIGVSLVLAGVLWVQKMVSPMIALLPLYMFFVGLLAIGVGWVVSSLHVYLRDTGQVLSVVLQLWFWMTPIMISEDLIPKRFHVVIDWNPMAWVVRAYRDRLLSGAWPHWHEVGILAAYSLAVFVAWWTVFPSLETRIRRRPLVVRAAEHFLCLLHLPVPCNDSNVVRRPLSLASLDSPVYTAFVRSCPVHCSATAERKLHEKYFCWKSQLRHHRRRRPFFVFSLRHHRSR